MIKPLGTLAEGVPHGGCDSSDSPVAHLPLVLGVVRKLNVAALIDTLFPPHAAHVLSCGRGVEALLLAILDGHHALYKIGARLEGRGMLPLLQPSLQRESLHDNRPHSIEAGDVAVLVLRGVIEVAHLAAAMIPVFVAEFDGNGAVTTAEIPKGEDLIVEVEEPKSALVLQRGFTPVGSSVRCGACDVRDRRHDFSAGDRSECQAPTPCQTRVGARPSPTPS